MSALLDARGWKATFKGEHGPTFSEPLMFWVLEEDGPVGYVLSERTGRPRSAEAAANFAGYVREEEADAVTVPAEPGWYAVERDGNGSDHAYYSKVLAWRIFSDGYEVRAIGVPFPDGTAMIKQVEEDRVQFVFDPTREPVAAGFWPTPANEMVPA